ncbi:hypothetical protein B7494_g788 [Chlorociboria aeruginascens]|nr:hypothetical protein B7494_g788 [Chlorociboria aeruginascens]
MKFQTPFSLAAVVGLANAHTIFTQLTSGGTQYGVGVGIRDPSYDGVLDPSHLGPVQAYLKKVGDATTDVGYGAGWFKVSEAGLINAATSEWATTDLIANLGVQNIPIPACIASGQYLLRAELIALHAASTTGGAQFYMECAQINISGGTGAKSPATVSIPGTYSATDPGILIDIYYPAVTNYTIPGPAVFTC